MTTHYCE